MSVLMPVRLPPAWSLQLTEPQHLRLKLVLMTELLFEQLAVLGALLTWLLWHLRRAPVVTLGAVPAHAEGGETQMQQSKHTRKMHRFCFLPRYTCTEYY